MIGYWIFGAFLGIILTLIVFRKYLQFIVYNYSL